MRPRFQADADLKEQIVAAMKRREPTVDFKTASEAGLEGLSDVDVLAAAAREGRILVTHDRRTMPHHFADFIKSNLSPGVFIASQQSPVNVIADEILLAWSASEAEEWVNVICTLPL